MTITQIRGASPDTAERPVTRLTDLLGARAIDLLTLPKYVETPYNWGKQQSPLLPTFLPITARFVVRVHIGEFYRKPLVLGKVGGNGDKEEEMPDQSFLFSDVVPQLSPDHQYIVESLIRELAKIEGKEVPALSSGKSEPLDHYIPAWQNSLGNRGFSPGTLGLYQWSIERLLANVPPPLTTIAIEGHIASRRQNGVSPTAVKTDIKSCKSFFGFLYDRNIIASDPTAKIEYPEIVRHEKVCPTDAEVAKFLAVLAMAKNPKAELMMFLFINTGIRFTEMATLTWGKINFESRKITVLGKGSKVRSVNMAAWLRDFLAKLRNGHSDDEMLFPTQSKTGKWDNGAANRMIAKLCRKASIKRYSCHQFRHYFATHTLKGTGDKGLKSVQAMLGHASAATTLDYYIHADEAEIRETHERFAPLSEGEVLKSKEDKGG